MAIKLLIGLQNPGSEYEKTRHNAGAWFASTLAAHYQCSFRLDKKIKAHLTELHLEKASCKLALPITFMNHSGQVARLLTQFYGIQPQELLIAHDELDLPPGVARLKTGGGHGGHNGLRDIIALLGSPLFHRLRIGIGHPGQRELVHQYVLSKPSLQDKEQITTAIDRAVDVMPLVLEGNLALAMNQLNTL